MVANPPVRPYKEQLVSEGIILGKSNNHSEALDKFTQALIIDPNFLPALRGKAQALRNLGEYREAIDYYDRAIENVVNKNDPDHYRALNGKGVVLAILNMYEDALKCYRKALTIKPDYLIPRINMADIFYELGDYKKSEEEYELIIAECRRKLKLVTDSQKEEYTEYLAFALNGEAWLFANTDNNITALERIREALTYTPEDSLSRDTMGYVIYNLGRDENDKERFNESMKQALEEFDKAEKESKNEQFKLLPIYHKGMVQIELKNYKNARQYFDKALDINPKFAEALNGKAVALSHDGNKDEAITALKKAIQFKPSLAAAQENLTGMGRLK